MKKEISFPEEMCLLVDFIENVIGLSSTPRQYSSQAILTHGDVELLSKRMLADEPRPFWAEVSEIAAMKNITFEAAYALLMDYLDSLDKVPECK